MNMHFFYQAEDGIRDGHVTGVQTSALPICFTIKWRNRKNVLKVLLMQMMKHQKNPGKKKLTLNPNRLVNSKRKPGKRSEERRVGKEGSKRRGRMSREEREMDKEHM